MAVALVHNNGFLRECGGQFGWWLVFGQIWTKAGLQRASLSKLFILMIKCEIRCETQLKLFFIVGTVKFSRCACLSVFSVDSGRHNSGTLLCTEFTSLQELILRGKLHLERYYQ